MKNIIFLLTMLILSLAAYAYQVEWGRNVVLKKPIYEDLYVAGGNITINAPVYGDVIIAGGTVIINDTIQNDLLVVGGTVQIMGYVMDDIRCAGGDLQIKNNVGGDLVITGGSILIDKNVVISGGLIASGGELTLNGTVNNNIKIGSGKLFFNGIANRNIDCRSNELVMNGIVFGNATLGARKLIIGNNASFNSGVRYWSKNRNPDFRNTVKGGKSVFDSSLKVATNNWYYLGHSTLLGMIWYLSVAFLFIILIEYLFARIFQKTANTISKSFWKSTGWGLLFFVGMPLLSLILLITIVGIPFGIMIMLLYIGLIILATIISAIVIANWYNVRFNNHWNYWQLVLTSFILFILLKVVTFTPLLGWLIMILIASLAFGSLLRNIDWTGKHKVAI